MRPKKCLFNRKNKKGTYLLRLEINKDKKYCPVIRLRNVNQLVRKIDYYFKKYECDVSIALVVDDVGVESHTLRYVL